MGMSKHNAEGYYDPTAFEGICRADKANSKLRIDFPTGYMNLNMEKFFPCPLNQAKKVFSLIHKYSSKVDKKRVINYLQGLENTYYLEMQEYAKLAKYYPMQSQEYRLYSAQFKESRKLRQRTIRNIEIFIEEGKRHEN